MVRMSAELTFIAELLNGVQGEAGQAPVEELATGIQECTDRGAPDPFRAMHAHLGSLIRKTGALSCLGEDIGRAGANCANLMESIGSDNDNARKALENARQTESSGTQASATLHNMRLKALDMLDALADLARRQAEFDGMAEQAALSSQGAAEHRDATVTSAQAFATDIGVEIQ